jgi:hypothetical protein
MPKFWLRYHHPDGRLATVVVLDADSLIAARIRAALIGQSNPGFECDGNELQEAGAPAEQIIKSKKPPALSVRCRPAAKRSVGSDDPSAPQAARPRSH